MLEKEIKGWLSGGEDASETDNGRIGRRLATAAPKTSTTARRNPSQRLFVGNTEEREGVRKIAALVY